MQKRLLLSLLLSVLLTLPLLTASVAAQEMAELPSLADLPVGEWSVLEPGGDTICLYGDPFRFFVRPAESEKLMIYFQGGGACWDGFTCGARGQFASQFDVSTDFSDETGGQGIFNLDNPDNPIADYNIVFVPVCTGDIHTGDAVVTYDVPKEALGVDFDQITVNFKGFVNAQAVLEWTYENFMAPEQVFVAGCSAGGYGATHNGPYIMQHYADTPVVHFSDAAAGVIARGWTGLGEWNIDATIPRFLPGLEETTAASYRVNSLYQGMAKLFPNNTLSQYNSFLDGVQIFFYAFQEGVNIALEENADQAAVFGGRWASAMRSSIVGLDATIPNFDYYMAGGGLHCITESANFFTYTVDGVRFVDWLAGLLDGTSGDVACDISAGECSVPPEGAQ